MLEEMIKELDAKVEFLINKNIQYRSEIERLRLLLDEANSKFTPENSDDGNAILSELKPLAENILSKINNLDTE